MNPLRKTFKNLLIFKEPPKKESFVLKEGPVEESKHGEPDTKQEILKKGVESRKGKNEGILFGKSRKQGANNGKDNECECTGKEEVKGSEISKSLSENLKYMKIIYNVPTNGDILIREFDIVIKNKPVAAFMIMIDGLTDRKVISDNILQPLMLLSNLDIKNEEKDVAASIRKQLFPFNQLKEVKQYEDIIDGINFGGCAVFVDSIDVVFLADVKGWPSRTISRPNTELVIRGPQEGFIELLRANTGLIRKILKDEDLIVENIMIGRRSQTPCSLLYIKDIANGSLVKEVRRRMESIKVDYIIDSGELEQMLEDSTFLPTPQILATERPDRVASMLSEGKVAVVMHGSPFVLVMPSNFTALIHSSEDSYVRFPYANLLRGIRLLGIIMSLLLPGMYVAITNFHQEMIPTDLVFAMAAAREKVPFPSVVEILIMEVSFELIREAGIRIPGPIGPTLGIIGALILGQAAVAANIVSPILIIAVAVTGIGSFAIPNFSLAFSFRILRFGYIFLGALTGFLGIALGLFLHGLALSSAKSFGVPFMAPFGPKTAGGLDDEISRGPVWRQELRPDFLNVKDARKQPRVSRGWTKQKPGEEKEDEE